jgi:hypothetical protein
MEAELSMAGLDRMRCSKPCGVMRKYVYYCNFLDLFVAYG